MRLHAVFNLPLDAVRPTEHLPETLSLPPPSPRTERSAHTESLILIETHLPHPLPDVAVPTANSQSAAADVPCAGGQRYPLKPRGHSWLEEGGRPSWPPLLLPSPPVRDVGTSWRGHQGSWELAESAAGRLVFVPEPRMRSCDS